MYDTLVNLQSGPRVLGETFEMRALPGKKDTLVDSISAFGSGFGGDPYSFAKLELLQGQGLRVLGTVPPRPPVLRLRSAGQPEYSQRAVDPHWTGCTPTGSYAWPQVNQSPFLFNTVRRMTDTNLTIFPLSKVTFRAGYSQNIFQGPSLTPSGYQIGRSTTSAPGVSAQQHRRFHGRRSTGSRCRAPS